MADKPGKYDHLSEEEMNARHADKMKKKILLSQSLFI